MTTKTDHYTVPVGPIRNQCRLMDTLHVEIFKGHIIVYKDDGPFCNRRLTQSEYSYTVDDLNCIAVLFALENCKVPYIIIRSHCIFKERGKLIASPTVLVKVALHILLLVGTCIYFGRRYNKNRFCDSRSIAN